MGLTPFSEEDAAFFFGRDADREIITANLLAAKLTLLYGASGVGKSSVLSAGVAHHLRLSSRRSAGSNGRPEFAVVTFQKWRDDPLAGLEAAIREELGQAVEPGSGSFGAKLQAWSRRVELLIILDQFEEYLLYHPGDNGEGTFAAEFARAVNRPDLRANFLVSMREDALAGLDRFKGRIPCLFENYLRVEHLTVDAAREAIEKPIAQYNRMRQGGSEFGIEAELVDAVLKQVRTGSVSLGEAAQGWLSAQAHDRIETPYLQLVMTRLWDEETAQGSRVLRLESLERLGGAESIVRTHLDRAIAKLDQREQDVASAIFRHLVTRARTKIAHNAADLSDFTELPAELIEGVLVKLSAGENRILSPVAPPANQPGAPRYQLYHDVLAPAALEWRARHEQARASAASEAKAAEQERVAREERRRAAKLRNLSWTLAFLVLVALAATVVAVWFNQRAKQAAQRAQQAAAEAEVQRERARVAEANASITYADSEARRLEAEAAKAKAAGAEAEAQRLMASAQAALASSAAIRSVVIQRKAESDLERVARRYYVSPYTSGFSLWYSGSWYGTSFQYLSWISGARFRFYPWTISGPRQGR